MAVIGYLTIIIAMIFNEFLLYLQIHLLTNVTLSEIDGCVIINPFHDCIWSHVLVMS